MPSVQAPESFASFVFPKYGLDLSMGFNRQRFGTTTLGNNVRTYEPGSRRARGGQRCGLSKYIPQQVPGGSFLQELGLIVGTYPPPGGHMQLSTSGRVVTLLAVSQGNVFIANAGDVAWTSVASNAGSPPLNGTGVVLSAQNIQKLWFADGKHYCLYDPNANLVQPWTASAGALPVDSAGNAPRIVETWRGRTVLTGLLGDPQDWFMSAVGDPTNWNYNPVPIVPTQAIAGTNAPQGLVGDVITGFIPYTDDVAIIGCDHQLWMMNGDPMAGGQLDVITKSIGMAWGRAWEMDPYGNIYFLSNRTGIYSLIPGQQPQRISQQIEQTLATYNTGATTARLIWDDRFQGLHVLLSQTGGVAATTHFFWESRTGAWWTDVFNNPNHNPLCCVTFDGNNPQDRAPLIGSWDGYVRTFDPTATNDDGTVIQSSVILGPILTNDLDDMLLKDLQAVLGTSSGSVQYAVLVGDTAEAALVSTPVATGTWTAGRNPLSLVRRNGYAVYIKLTGSGPWSMETVRARIAGTGKVRRRAVKV